jgi:hypothetical protein
MKEITTGMPDDEVLASIEADREPGPAATKIAKAYGMLPEIGGPLFEVGKRLGEAFDTGYGITSGYDIEHSIPEDARAWAIAAVWEARCGLVEIAQATCLSDDHTFQLAKTVLGLLDGALADWGMR